MMQSIIPRDQVAEQLAVPLRLRIRYEARGLVRAHRGESGVEDYGPAEIHRVGAIVSYQRDLGINLAGVEAVLRLRDHIQKVHGSIQTVACELQAALEREPVPDDDA